MITYDKMLQYIGARIHLASPTIKIFSNKPERTSDYPYCVYKLFNNSHDESICERYTLQIDFWDKASNNEENIDTTNILMHIENVKGSFKDGIQSESDGAFKSELTFNSEVPEDTRGIYHHIQKYLLKIF
jgi:hypothetical protein